MPLSVLIAGGGTGGHLYPGIAVARELMARVPSAEVAFVGALHARPHAPQWTRLARVSTSHPLPAAASQSPKPAAHASPQREPAQEPVALAAAGHRTPQPPQWLASMAKLASQPLSPLLSQSP